MARKRFKISDDKTYSCVVGDYITEFAKEKRAAFPSMLDQALEQKVLHLPKKLRKEEDKMLTLAHKQALKVVKSIPSDVKGGLKIDEKDLTSKIEEIFYSGCAFLPFENQLLAAAIAHTNRRFAYIFNSFNLTDDLISQLGHKAIALKDRPEAEFLFITGKYFSNEGIDMFQKVIDLSQDIENIFIYVIQSEVSPLYNFVLIDNSVAILEAIHTPHEPALYCKALCHCNYEPFIIEIEQKLNEWLFSPETFRGWSRDDFIYPIPKKVQKRLLDYFDSHKISDLYRKNSLSDKRLKNLARTWLDKAVNKGIDPDNQLRNLKSVTDNFGLESSSYSNKEEDLLIEEPSKDKYLEII